jgi:hypothetical protein
MNSAEYIKSKLDVKVLETSLVPQENGSYIVMERCEISGRYKVVLVYDSDDESNDESNDKAVVVC